MMQSAPERPRRISAVDQLGRVCIPVKIRRALGLQDGTPVQFHYDPETRTCVIRPSEKRCTVCGAPVTERQHLPITGALVYLCDQCLTRIVQERGVTA